VVMDVRGDLQALDLEDLSALLNKAMAFLSRETRSSVARFQMHPNLAGREAAQRVSVAVVGGRKSSSLRDEAQVSLLISSRT